MSSIPTNKTLQLSLIQQDAITQNRERLRKHQERIHELIDYLIGVKPLEFQNAINYRRTAEDEQRLLWHLHTTRKNVIEPLQKEYQQLIAMSPENHE